MFYLLKCLRMCCISIHPEEKKELHKEVYVNMISMWMKTEKKYANRQMFSTYTIYG